MSFGSFSLLYSLQNWTPIICLIFSSFEHIMIVTPIAAKNLLQSLMLHYYLVHIIQKIYECYFRNHFDPLWYYCVSAFPVVVFGPSNCKGIHNFPKTNIIGWNYFGIRISEFEFLIPSTVFYFKCVSKSKSITSGSYFCSFHSELVYILTCD